MTVAKKKCKCHGDYQLADKLIKTPKGNFCSYKDAIEWANVQTSNRITRENNKVKQVRAKEVKAFNIETKRRKELIKPKAQWLSELQSLFNKYVRLRDINDDCISCDKDRFWQGQWHCSHYYSRGHSSALRFNLFNCHKSCSICNNHLSGNIGEYTPRIINKIGKENFDFLLQNKSNVRIYDIEWIKRAIRLTKKAIKRLEN